MRRYLTRAEFTALQAGPATSFSRLEVVITDETSQPIYVYNTQTNQWDSLVTAQTNDITGKIENSPAVSAVKSSLITCINGNQFQYSGVPKDTSGNGNDLIVKAGITEAQLYANAGYFSAIAGSDGYPYLNNSKFAFTMGQDSILVGVIVNDAVPAANESRFGCANTTTRPGFYWSARMTSGAGRVVLTTTGTGGASYQGADTACAFYDGTPHHLIIGIDGPSRSVFVWRDGVLVQSQLNLFPNGGGLCTSNFSFGTNQDTGGASVSVACKHAGFQVLRWLNQGLPTDVNLIAQTMAAMPRNPVRVSA